MGYFAEYTCASIQISRFTNVTLLCSCMGKSKYQEARKFSIVHQLRYFRDKVISEFNGYRSATGHTSNRHCCSDISAKFQTKVLQNHHRLRERVIQQQNSLTFITTQRNITKQFYNLKFIDHSDDHSFTEGVSRNHILHRWNSRWLYPDFDTHPKNLVHRDDIDPMLMKVNTTKQVMWTAIELLLDINPSINNFADSRSLTASPLCKETEETATHFLFDCTIYESANRPAKKFNLYDLRDCVNLIEFIRTSGRFV